VSHAITSRSTARTSAASPTNRVGIRHVSVVVPTRNEAGNVRPLLDRLAAHQPDVIGEVLFVDDSDDDTAAVIEVEGAGRPFAVRVLHREPGHRVNGLSGAVIDGLRGACGDWVCVMDGDLQHPPELIAEMIARAEASGASLMCATRYVSGGDNGGLAFGRSVVSRVSTGAAKVLFPRALAGVSDPMSGFFLLRRNAVETERLRPRGFKILLEVMVREPGLRTGEVPYKFDERTWGDTKASLRQGVQYIAHLGILRLSSARERLRTQRGAITSVARRKTNGHSGGFRRVSPRP
jgi:dolichol-phosphate mannosyltransferase